MMKELHRLKRNEQQVKTLEDIIKFLKAHGKEVAEKYGIRSIRIFGSYTEGKQKETSDLDLIVVFEKTPSHQNNFNMTLSQNNNTFKITS